jgi:hypothetical protein
MTMPAATKENEMTDDRKVLLKVADGPDGITLYTSEQEAIATWADGETTLFLEVSNGLNAYAKFGPFLPEVLKQVRAALAPAVADAAPTDLHQQIMNLPADPTKIEAAIKTGETPSVIYKYGHRDARHAAAELACAAAAPTGRSAKAEGTGR